MLQPLVAPHLDTLESSRSTLPTDRVRQRICHASVTRTDALLASSAILLTGCVLFVCLSTIHWPLAGDASLIHYIDFLMEHGRVPYRDIDDMNLPGAYFIDYVVMHVLGTGSLAWRIFDMSLMLTASFAMVSIARPYGWFPGVFAGTLLTLIHGRDGIFQLGQRDLTIAVLMLMAYAALFKAVRDDAAPWMLLFGVCSSMMVTIKPVFLPFGAALLICTVCMHTRRRQSMAALVRWGVCGLFIPFAALIAFLWATHSVTDFIAVMRGIMPYHASLARKPIRYLFLHACSPLLPLCGIWIIGLVFQWRYWLRFESACLLIGVLLGLASYVIQGKGYSYQRYPFLAPILLVMSLDVYRCLHSTRWAQAAGWMGIAFGTLFLAPVSTVKASQYDWRNHDFSVMLTSDLQRLGGRDLSGKVQCIDTIGGCFGVLYDLQLLQTDRFVYDEFLFNPTGDTAVARTRDRFLSEMEKRPPQYLIITNDLFPLGPRGFRKLSAWPRFDSFVRQNYVLCAEGKPSTPVRWWSRTEQPVAYEIFCNAATVT